MTNIRTHRISSEARGIEGPFRASELLQMARSGRLFGTDRIERAPGQWALAASSPEIRMALTEWARRLGPIAATNASAALLGLRSVGPAIAAEGAGRCALAAVASQHGSLEVAAEAAELLSRHDEDGLGRLAGQVVEYRRNAESGVIDLDLVRNAVTTAFADVGWAAFVEMARRIDPFGGTQPLWRPSDEGKSPVHLLRERRIRTLGGVDDSGNFPVRLDQSIDLILAAGDLIDSGDLFQLDLNGHPIIELERLPSRALDVIRRAERIDLAQTPLREVPSWLFEGKSRVALGSTMVRRLPEDLNYKRIRTDLDIDLEGTLFEAFPQSWVHLEIDTVYLSRCPLRSRGLEWVPKCNRIDAVRCALAEVEVIGNSPRELDLSENGLTHVPDAIRERMDLLRKLQLSSNRISDIPAWLLEAPRLRELELAFNLLTNIDIPLSSMPSLREIQLQNNLISEVSEEVFADRQLLTIDLSANLLASVPPIIYPTGRIDLSDNPLSALPLPLNDHSAPQVGWADAFGFDEDDESSVAESIGTGSALEADSVEIPSSVDFGDDEASDEDLAAGIELEPEADDSIDTDTDTDTEMDVGIDIDFELSDDGEGVKADSDDSDDGDDLDEDADGDADDSWDLDADDAEDADHGPFATEVEDWQLNAVSISATNTSITAIPPELLDLKISGLDLTGNRWLRAIPHEILSMPTLTSLNLGSCHMLRESDLDGRECWSGWPAERRAAVDAGRKAQDDGDEESCTVDLSGTSFPEVPGLLGRAARRLQLDLSESAMAAWPRGAVRENGLESLELRDCPIRSIEEVGGVRFLKRLALSRSTGVPTWLGACRHLESLELPGLRPDDCPRGLASLVECTTLELGGRSLASVPAFVASLPALEDFAIHSSSVGELPALLGKCRSLKRISVADSPVGRIDPAILALPSLESIEFSASGVVDLPEFPEGCTLERLEIDSASLVRVPASIARCSALRKLTFSGVSHVELPDSIAQLTLLQEVQLPANGVHESMRARLARLLPATQFS